MTREEFIEIICRNTGIDRKDYDRRYVALPCKCNESSCRGWANVFNDPESIIRHCEDYAPSFAELVDAGPEWLGKELNTVDPTPA